MTYRKINYTYKDNASIRRQTSAGVGWVGEKLERPPAI